MKAFTVGFLSASALLLAQPRTFVPVTSEMLLNPSPNDWLMYNRTYDSQRYSPLKQIDKSNVDQLRMVWTRGQGAGAQEGIPLVHNGVMYLMAPGAAIQALDATNGNLLWEYQRKLPANQASQARSKTIGMWEDMVYTTTPDSFLVALDAKTGEMRWETKTDTRGNISGAVVAGNKIISGGSCTGNHVNCYISAHDAKTGKLLWKFATAANTGEPGGDSWGDTPDDKRFAGTWGEPGTYDPTTNTVIWGVANPTPNTRMERHGNPFGVPTSGPVDLFSDSTIAINADTGKLVWYYQHLAGDDWDEDWTNDRILASTALNPTAATAKWFNTKIKAGEKRDVVIATGESGGVFAMDRHTGEFLWANPWPFEFPDLQGRSGRKSSSERKSDLHRAESAQGHLFLQHAQLLVAGLQPGDELAVRALGGYLPGHADQGKFPDRSPGSQWQSSRRFESRRILRRIEDKPRDRQDRSHL
jgi:alcohol dehydrogenase (cytochrome c)